MKRKYLYLLEKIKDGPEDLRGAGLLHGIGVLDGDS